MGLGKTVQSIALILANRHDELAEPPPFGPVPYESEGTLKLRSVAEKLAAKAAAKAAKAAERAAASASKAAAKAAAKDAKDAAKAAAKGTAKKSPAGKGAAPSTASDAGAAAVASSSASLAAVPSPAAAAAGMVAADDEPEFEAFLAAATGGSATASPAAGAGHHAAVGDACCGDGAGAAAAHAAALPPSPAWAPLKDVSSALDRLTARAAVCKATLVVCPVIALTQWRAEIARHTRPGTLKVLIYHGQGRSASVQDVSAFDVVRVRGAAAHTSRLAISVCSACQLSLSYVYGRVLARIVVAHCSSDCAASPVPRAAPPPPPPITNPHACRC